VRDTSGDEDANTKLDAFLHIESTAERTATVADQVRRQLRERLDPRGPQHFICPRHKT
jgi:hypothetical protein